MADDRIQRPIRASQPPTRSAPGQVAGSSGNDPLAELARLIGQNDPFAEYGRENVRRAVQQTAPAPQAPAPVYADDRYAAAPPLAAQHSDYIGPETYPPEHYAHTDSYQARGQVPGYSSDAGYDRDADYPTNVHSGAEDRDFYDDVPPRRRMGILAITAVFALAVIGTAGAFGYRALFGSSGSNGPPPVIKADESPTKIVPAANSKDPKSGKLIYDRVAERGQDEKLVSREEQPVDRPPVAAMSQSQPGAPVGSIQTPIGSSVVATEPKKVHTIAIRPDGTTVADAVPMPAAGSTPQPAPIAAAPAPIRAQAVEPPPHQTAERAEPPPRRVAVQASSSGPLSLSPDAPEQSAWRPTRTAAAVASTQIAPAPARAAPASSVPSGGGSGYAVQVTSQRSEADAQSAFRNLQSKYPVQLGGKQPLIRQVDLGAKGTFYRAMVGPLGSEEASQLCSSLKAAGGQCIIQRN